ncbi:MAG TPA: serine/threonine-protein phosphatase [Hydrogenobaculum sp.]|nr:serine/threonine-protein phosphatase [Hydrogenobaculum sp.]
MNIVYECGQIIGDKNYQSDEIFVQDSVFAVADGMGDKNSGKLASKIAIQVLERYLYDIEKAFNKINKEIINRLSKYADGLICGTTLSVLKCDLNTMMYHIYHVGDSKIFLIRNKSLIQLTKDQSKLENHKKYVKALGTNWSIELYKEQGNIEKNDIFLISTDGICDIKDILEDIVEKDPKAIKEHILSKERLIKDNLSFIVLKVF